MPPPPDVRTVLSAEVSSDLPAKSRRNSSSMATAEWRTVVPQRARRATRLVVIWNNRRADEGGCESLDRRTGRAFFGHVSV